MDTLFGKLLEYGNTPALIVLAFLVLWLIKKLDENGHKDEQRSKELRSIFVDAIKDVETRFEERFGRQDKRIDYLEDRMSGVERDYLPRDEHYKEFSGWRAEIGELRALLINLFKDQGRKS